MTRYVSGGPDARHSILQKRSGNTAGESDSHTTVCSSVIVRVKVPVFRRKIGIARARAERTRKR